MESILELSEDGKTIIGVKDKNVTLITIPKSITSIGDSAFSGCSSLQSIDIPNSVTTIGNGAFSDCSSLQSINITKGNKHYESIDGILFSKDLTCILKLPEGKKLEEYTIPNSVTTIGKGAFDRCSSLQSIDIPNSVTTIGNLAFRGCSSLQSIDIPNSVTTIGYDAFFGCSSLQSIDIPNSVTTIGNWAFSGCSSLQSIDIPNSVTTIGNGAFYDCSSLQSIHLHWTNLLDIKISDTALRYCTEDYTLYIPPGTRWEYRHHSIWGNFKNIEIEKQE